MDNTVKENKNNLVLAFLAALVHYGFFLEVRVYFLPVGHTHVIIDQRFSVLHFTIVSKDAFSLPQLVDELKGLTFKQAWAVHKEVKVIRDYDWLLDHSYTFFGLGTIRGGGEKYTAHAFKISKDSEGKVALLYKDHDLPADLPDIPEIPGRHWWGHHQSTRPLRIFKDDKPLPPLEEVPSPTAMPRRRLKKLHLIKEKVTFLKASSP